MNCNLLDKAYKHCINHGYRFTEPRERVLKILVDERKPLGAYDILQRLSMEVENPKPPTVYRAIQFWHQEGFIHCIDSLKSYVACLHGHHVGQAQFFICNQCDFVKELECSVDFTPVIESANAIEFSIINYTLEIKGVCAACK
jgi:Fur family transcriptional regulator, zinc uptake regulator